MYNSLQIAIKYLDYYLNASNGKGHGIHSPFIFNLVTKVFNGKTPHSISGKIELLRKKLLKDKQVFNIRDFGAGSLSSNSKTRSVASIAAQAAKSPKYGQLLFRLIHHYQPQTIVELGTSLGLTTAYLASGNPYAKIITMEGDASIGGMAKQNFQTLGLKNIELVEGNFDETLSTVIRELATMDFVFIDGNHRQEPTLRYFNQFLPKVNNNSILVFDDIHWSRDMEAAWKIIKDHPAVTGSVDLFFMGLIFFRKEFQEKQHFRIRF